jgi:hypothetical protein
VENTKAEYEINVQETSFFKVFKFLTILD